MVESAFIGILVAGLGFLGIIAGHIISRLNALEDDLAAERAFNRRLWEYTRRILDLYYRYRKPDAPDPGPLPNQEQTP